MMIWTAYTIAFLIVLYMVLDYFDDKGGHQPPSAV